MSFLLTCLAAPGAASAKPNVVVLLCDDLGWGDVGFNGQQKIRTPNLDRIAVEGIQFPVAYSGSAVCAPARCSLLTGKHTGHAAIRSNGEIGAKGSFDGQMPLPAAEVTLAEVLKQAGYATAAVGKWGLGRAGSEGDPNRQGFDLFFGYNCQRHAHNYYPTYLERNEEKVPLEGNDGVSATGRHYAPDLMIEEALSFVRTNRAAPFFLYFASPVPHLGLQVPEDSLREYAGSFEPETPYLQKGDSYVSQETPRAAYAAMVTRMDRDIGRLLDLLDVLGLATNTLVVFTSDNGATYPPLHDPDYFGSNGRFRGAKGQLFEGGIRVPFAVRWPARIRSGVCGDPVAGYDIFPTVCAAAGAAIPPGVDGADLLPLLVGRGATVNRPFLMWEYHGYGGQQAVRAGDWKLVRQNLAKGPAATLLFDLKDDPSESHDLAKDHPAVVQRLEKILADHRTPAPLFQFPALDTPAR